MSTTARSDSPARPTDVSRISAAFVTTHWSVVLMAGKSDVSRAEAALESLCQTYWPPLYAYVRKRGYSPQDAEDLTQEFFARLLERKGIGGVSPEKGRFRSFLLASMNHFLSDAWDKARACKRGGGKVIPLDLAAAETRLGSLVADEITPEKVFDRRWALTLLEVVYQRLEEEYRKSGRNNIFEVLRSTLAGSGGGSESYQELGRRLGISEAAVKVAVHRLRHRYRGLLRSTIAETVADAADIEDELRYLLQTIAAQ